MAKLTLHGCISRTGGWEHNTTYTAAQYEAATGGTDITSSAGNPGFVTLSDLFPTAPKTVTTSTTLTYGSSSGSTLTVSALPAGTKVSTGDPIAVVGSHGRVQVFIASGNTSAGGTSISITPQTVQLSTGTGQTVWLAPTMKSSNSIDTAVTSIRAYNPPPNGTGPSTNPTLALKLRIHAGVQTPTWITNAFGGTVTMTDPTGSYLGGNPAQIPKFWTQAFQTYYWQVLAPIIAAKYDSAANYPEIAQINMSPNVTFYMEPCDRQTASASDAQALYTAGYFAGSTSTPGSDLWNQANAITNAISLWPHTLRGMAFNPYQRIDPVAVNQVTPTTSTSFTNGSTSGTTLTVTALPAAVATGDTIVVVDNTGMQQWFVASGNAAKGATSISITAQTVFLATGTGYTVLDLSWPVKATSGDNTSSVALMGVCRNNDAFFSLENNSYRQIYETPGATETTTLTNGANSPATLTIQSPGLPSPVALNDQVSIIDNTGLIQHFVASAAAAAGSTTLSLTPKKVTLATGSGYAVFDKSWGGGTGGYQFLYAAMSSFGGNLAIQTATESKIGTNPPGSSIPTTASVLGVFSAINQQIGATHVELFSGYGTDGILTPAQVATISAAMPQPEVPGPPVNLVGSVVYATTGGAATTLSINAPGLVNPGDLILPNDEIVIYVGAVGNATLSIPGFTNVSASLNGTTCEAQVFYRKCDGTETTFTLSSTATHPMDAALVAVRGENIGRFYDAGWTPTSGTANGSSTTLTVGTVTTQVTNCLGLWFGYACNTSTGGVPATITVPGSVTAQGTQVASTAGSSKNIAVLCGIGQFPSAGAVGSVNGTLSTATNMVSGGVFIPVQPYKGTFIAGFGNVNFSGSGTIAAASHTAVQASGSGRINLVGTGTINFTLSSTPISGSGNMSFHGSGTVKQPITGLGTITFSGSGAISAGRHVLIEYRGGTAATWTLVNPVLASREPGLEVDTGLVKFGDGKTPWNSLPYAYDAAGTAASLVATETQRALAAEAALGTGTGVTLDSTATDIQPLGTRAAGSVGKAADAGHVHAMPSIDQLTAPAANVAWNSKKITGLANGTASTDAAAFGQIPVIDSTASDIQALGAQAAGSTGKVADAGHVHTMPRLDQVSAPTASVALNSQKITGLANGTASTDAAAFGQIPVIDSTASDIQSFGAISAGSTGKVADAGHVHSRKQLGLLPDDYGLIAWNQPLPTQTGGTIVQNAGTLYMLKIWIPTCTVTNVCLGLNAQGSTLTSGQNLAALFNGSKTLLSATADQATSWSTAGNVGGLTIPLTTPQSVTAGWFYVGFFCHGTTLPTFLRQSTNLCINNYLSAANSMFATADTGLTTSFPSTAGTLTALTTGYWCGVS